MTSIAQGKRSDTLGKPPHPITLRPARAKVNITRSVSTFLPLHGASYTTHYTQGVASLALGYELLPLRGVSAKTRPHRKVLRMRKNLCRAAICGRTFPCRMPHSKSHIPHPSSHIQHPTFHIQHSNIPHPTLHILNIPPPNLHCFSCRAPPRIQIRHS